MNDETELKKHRMFLALLLIVGLLAVWNIRLFWIQVVATRSFTGRGIDLLANSVIQRENGIVLDSGRGDFVDRNGDPLTGKELKVLTVFPVREEGSAGGRREESLNRIAEWMGIPGKEWHIFVSGLKSPEIWSESGRPVALTDSQAERIEALGLPDVRVMRYKQRYAQQQPASHVIGFIGQNPERIMEQFSGQIQKGELQLTSKIGNAGLEKTFDYWLQGIGATSVSLFTDGMKRPLPGLDVRIISPDNPYYPLKMVTTLNKGIQSHIEFQMERLGIAEGAVVVLDIRNADTVAMASRPSFHPGHVDPTEGHWSNRALKATVPGSIFKTVTAAAALEEKAVHPDETFECNGELGKYGFTCWKKGGHGHLTLEEGFAQSCNIVFAEAAKRIGAEKLEQYAQKLGLGTLVGWSGAVPGQADFRQWDGEEKGQVYHLSTDKRDEGALVQTAIGQRDVQVTPLQVANLVVSLYAQGKVLSPRIVQEIRFQNDRLHTSFPPRGLAPEGAAPISPDTAQRLLAWMKEVVDHGTGTALQAAKWPLAGKSGTAQLTLKNGKPGENHWFIGYGPADQPRYAVAVLVQNVPQGYGNKSVPLFKEVMDILAAP
ncbi:penicillin-binding protein [Paenibacillus sp. JMULE4]|uniref:peptidoglycan D,D-transpeptidase FtsI family protein n=1 Tax=Paenibacillus sp. JMULE4 TaxID=2518342 RepID=UPI001576728A|nr:penicillin-binding transpeptidase domain-containing protein [Paenibacillus sp. JMULE4]NTZ17246.1 penicillin-binding protein [Paenibacillus sp. JMULE4]